MFPTIDDRKVYDVRLAPEDIKAIQKLYGRNTRKVSPGNQGKTSWKLRNCEKKRIILDVKLYQTS